MKRREFISLVGASIAWPLSARSETMLRRVGVVMGFPNNDPQGERCVSEFRATLAELGWLQGKNLDVQVRWAGGDRGKAEVFIKELLALNSEVIVPSTNQVADVVRQLVKTTPVVFAFLGAPVESGLVKSIQAPGGNITGFPDDVETVGEKWVELQKEIAPQMKRAAFLYHPDAAPHRVLLGAVQRAGAMSSIQIVPVAVRNSSEIEGGLHAFDGHPGDGLLVAVHAVTASNRETIIGLAAKQRLIAVYGNRIFVQSGGLLSYGSDSVAQFRGAATYVDRVLKGAKPGDLPVQMPTTFQMVVNLKSAKAQDIQLPALLLARADEVIE